MIYTDVNIEERLTLARKISDQVGADQFVRACWTVAARTEFADWCLFNFWLKIKGLTITDSNGNLLGKVAFLVVETSPHPHVFQLGTGPFSLALETIVLQLVQDDPVESLTVVRVKEDERDQR